MLIGLVGKPNTGKSTFFKAATLADVLIANYPFVTIKPNHGVGYVRIDCIDKELKVQCVPREGYCVNGQRFVPIGLMDVAGLVPGASEGKGLGNQFLNDLGNADAFIQIVDLSGETDAEGKQTSHYYPGEDIKFLEKELNLWYAGLLKKVWKTFSKKVIAGKEDFAEAVAKQFSGLKVTREHVNEVIAKINLNILNAQKWTDEQLFEFSSELRKISKPMIIAGNKIDRPDSAYNLKKIKEEFDYPIIACSAESELALKEASFHKLIEYLPGDDNFKIRGEISEKQKSALEFIKKNVLEKFGSTGVQEVLNKTVFEILKYIAIFPAGAKLTDSKGNILPDCFLLPPGSTALDFAYHLHTDIGNNFVKAIDIRTKRAVGKDYKLKNRDGIEIMTR
ncbi:redox-regulated ATPase YchF [Candidatus Pacearchaeota archaeon]|nr:redox-regulated ATPase YchF [Candidatus Pacearchaeota archaeon]